MDQQGNVCGGMKFGAGCFMEECLCADSKNWVDFDDAKSDDYLDDDIVNLLPNDPFGMDLNLCLPNDPFGMDLDIEATVAAVIADFMEELKACGFDSDETSENKSIDDDKFFAELNLVWTGSLKCEQEEGEDVMVDSDVQSMFLGEDMEELMWFLGDKYQREPVTDYDNSDGGAPADALFYSLGYLGVRDLLSVEMVCRSLRDAVQNDPLLWRSIDIDTPLNGKITNDILLQLTNRAQGTLGSLSLVRCSKITNVGLKRVFDSNPGLTKLSVPGCIGLCVEGVLENLKAFNSSALPGIKHLRIGELFGLTNQHFNEFKLLLNVDEDKKYSNHNPRFYHAGSYLPLDDERAIDIETCPRCQQARQVYDCPAESCQVKDHSTEETCRACIFCVARCTSCGCCLDNKIYKEMFSLEFLCWDCWTNFLNCEDSLALSPRHAYYWERGSYHFLLFS